MGMSTRATDDHGTPAELGAYEAGLDVAIYCSRWHQRQREVYRRFGLSFDHFGRTSSPQNREPTQHFYRRLDERGYIGPGRPFTTPPPLFTRLDPAEVDRLRARYVGEA